MTVLFKVTLMLTIGSSLYRIPLNNLFGVSLVGNNETCLRTESNEQLNDCLTLRMFTYPSMSESISRVPSPVVPSSTLGRDLYISLRSGTVLKLLPETEKFLNDVAHGFVSLRRMYCNFGKILLNILNDYEN